MGKDCEWERPRAPAVRLLWDVRAADAVVEVLGSTTVGCRAASRMLGRGRRRARLLGRKGKKGGWVPLRLYFLCFFLCQAGGGAGGWGALG